MTNLKFQIAYQRHLPHLQIPGSMIFVTFRLSGSIPEQEITRLAEAARQASKRVDGIADRLERERQASMEYQRLFGKYDDILDCYRNGSSYLVDPQIAEMVYDHLLSLNQKYLDLESFCIMPNHIHIVLTPLEERSDSYYSLAQITKQIKVPTARKANRMLSIRGEFWQHESYDHVVRDQDELERINRYILNNPVKAGLVQDTSNWKWAYQKHEQKGNIYIALLGR
jgi:putative transposase